MNPKRMKTLLGEHAVTKAFRSGEVSSPELAFEFADSRVLARLRLTLCQGGSASSHVRLQFFHRPMLRGRYVLAFREHRGQAQRHQRHHA